MDTYVAEEMKASEELRVNKIIDHNIMELYLERNDCQKRPFRTASRTEIFEIVKANTKPIEVSFFGNLLNSLRVLVNDPVNESNLVGSFMVILNSSSIRLHKMLRSTLTWIFHPKRQLTIAFTLLSQEQISLT